MGQLHEFRGKIFEVELSRTFAQDGIDRSKKISHNHTGIRLHWKKAMRGLVYKKFTLGIHWSITMW